ncbi:AAA family ATPase [Actinophytocola xanthii]|uniref:AAA family ATPase n=1 Tax=Actinophytocola xanthii TaxID=1912961 RepID=UPI0009FA8D67|nr:AAA family ATPase [Actinophytocola xanthii]
MAAATGNDDTRLVVLRGNSGAGKTTVALRVRSHLGRTCALVQQDVIRRTILKERDIPDGANIGLISHVTRYALDHGYNVIIEGILHAERYAYMLAELADDHRAVLASAAFSSTSRRPSSAGTPVSDALLSRECHPRG